MWHKNRLINHLTTMNAKQIFYWFWLSMGRIFLFFSYHFNLNRFSSVAEEKKALWRGDRALSYFRHYLINERVCILYAALNRTNKTGSCDVEFNVLFGVFAAYALLSQQQISLNLLLLYLLLVLVSLANTATQNESHE